MSKLLALNIIVGPNEKENLDRLLFSEAAACFDEVILVNTCDEILTEYPAKVINHQWASERYPYGNFAAARNAAKDNTESKYIMWCDCDDALPSADEILELKRVLEKNPRDFYLMPYLINKNEQGKYTTVFKRERIFKNDPKVKWMHPCHEQIDLSKFDEFGDIGNCAIRHESKKAPMEGLKRNLLIQEYELKFDGNVHLRFNYAKDLIFKNNHEFNKHDQVTACLMLEEIVCKHELSPDNLTMICALLTQTYAYESIDGNKPTIVAANKEKAELYARLCISLNPTMAEAYVILGDYFLIDGHISIDSAIQQYKTALASKPKGTSVRQLAFYKQIPILRLMHIYEAQNEIGLALHYNTEALKLEPLSKELKEIRKRLKCQII